MGQSSMANEPSLRLSDAEREAVVTKLSDAYGEGRLDVEEFQRRVDLAYAAKIHGEVTELTSDLPVTLAPETTKRRSHRLRHFVSGVSSVWAIWLVILLTGGGVQGWWPLWVTVPWGVAELL